MSVSSRGPRRAAVDRRTQRDEHRRLPLRLDVLAHRRRREVDRRPGDVDVDEAGRREHVGVALVRDVVPASSVSATSDQAFVSGQRMLIRSAGVGGST